MMETLKTITTIAKSFEGVREGTNRHKQIVDSYNEILPHPRGYVLTVNDSWCAAFVSVVMRMAGIAKFPSECGVHEMQAALYNQDCLIRGRLPQAGELVFFKPSHVGICLGSNVDDGCIVTIEGNSMDMVRIAYHYFNDANLWCFASPWAYNLAEVAEGVIAGWYGNGEVRKKSLEENGYNYNQVQEQVNKILGGVSNV